MTFYSGLPSATPAVQGELFYGVPCAVPSFCFRDRQTGRPVRMFDPAPAAKVQARLGLLGDGLLRGGSAYCDIFSGGAAEPHFCPSSGVGNRYGGQSTPSTSSSSSCSTSTAPSAWPA